jgi:predicted DNA-binding transcriptional regulator AlpA
MLAEWVTATRSRNERVRAAMAAGLSKHRVHQITGIGRSTIDRILASGPAAPDRGERDGA